MYPTGGYKTITPVQIANVLGRQAGGAITSRAVRVYLACFELQAVREAAGRTIRRPHSSRVAYSLGEIARLVGAGSEVVVKSELRRLARAGLVRFSSAEIAITTTPLDGTAEVLSAIASSRGTTRPIPVPRRVLAYLCSNSKPAVVKTTLAYLARGLSFARGSGEVRGAGAVKATWLAGVLDLSERAVRTARAELISVGLISRDTGSHQWKLNRDGAYFRINLEWQLPGRVTRQPRLRAIQRTDSDAAKTAPLRPDFSAGSAPPELKPETPSDLKDQKLAVREPTGVRGTRKKPDLRDIGPGDLRRLEPLRELFRQAVAARWLPAGEASFLGFTAAAVRANRATGDAVRIFVAVVRRKLWHHISQADEERAREVIGREARRLTCQQDSVLAAITEALSRSKHATDADGLIPSCRPGPAREILPVSAAETLRLSGTWSVTDGHRDGRHHPESHLTSGRRGATSPVA